MIWDLDAALSPVTKSVEATEDKVPNGNFGPSMETLRNLNSNVINNGQSHGYSPIAAKGHKESVYALAMNDARNLLVSRGTKKVLRSSTLEQFNFLFLFWLEGQQSACFCRFLEKPFFITTGSFM